VDLPTAQRAQLELVDVGIPADLRTLSGPSIEGGLAADYAVEVYLGGLNLEQLEAVVGVAKKHSTDLGIGRDARLMMN
jgi:hypothetical protein